MCSAISSVSSIAQSHSPPFSQALSQFASLLASAYRCAVARCLVLELLVLAVARCLVLELLVLVLLVLEQLQLVLELSLRLQRGR